MKKFIAVTTSLIATACALGLGGSALAFAETGTSDDAVNKQFYPDTFEIAPSFKNLEDYAVGNGEYLFLQDNRIYEYGNERVTVYKDPVKPVKFLYFEDGAFYYRTADDCYYALANFDAEENPEIEDFASTTKTDDITVDNYHYYFNASTNVLKVIDQSTDVIESLDGFTNLKLYGDTVYAVNDNFLYKLNGTETEKVTVKNFEQTENIAVGGAFAGLTSSADSAPSIVTLTDGAYMTEVDLNELNENSSTFTVGDTVRVSGSNTVAIVLYNKTNSDKTQGIFIIAVNGKSYLIHPQDVTEKTTFPFTASEYEKGTATEGYIYSAPFESVGTRISTLPYGTEVKILKEIKMDKNPIDGDFYYVKYEVDEETAVQGYVRFGLITTYDFNEAPPEETPDPDYTTEDLVKPVVLILIVLLLIAIAAGYIIYVGTSDKRKKKNASVNTDANQQNKN